jgi:hypothetical protein
MSLLFEHLYEAIARLERENHRLADDANRSRLQLQEACRDAEILAAAENERRENIEGVTPYPELESVRFSRDELFAAMGRAAQRSRSVQ